MSGDWTADDLAGQEWAEGAYSRRKAARSAAKRLADCEAELDAMHERLNTLEAYLSPAIMERAMAPMTETIAHSRAA